MALMSDERLALLRERIFHLDWWEAQELLAEVDRLRGAVDTLYDMLERVQWGNTGACPECKALPPTHGPGCALDAALRGAGE